MKENIMNPEQIKCACGEILNYLTKEKGSPKAKDYPIMSEANFYTFKCQKCHKNHERHWYLNEEKGSKTEVDLILRDTNYVQLHAENLVPRYVSNTSERLDRLPVSYLLPLNKQNTDRNEFAIIMLTGIFFLLLVYITVGIQ